MAQPVSQSPRRVFGDRSPPKAQSGLSSTSPHDQSAPLQVNGQRQMLPPSPQSYYPRFHPHASSISNGSLPQNAGRDLPPPQHRPSSSMSISSMLGSEPDRPPLTSVTTSPYHAKPPNSFSEMSPPQNSVNPNPGEYSYKPRSQTPDRMGISNLLGTRPYRSGSGSIMQVSAPCEDSAQASSRAAFQRFGEPMQQPPSQEPTKLVEEPVNHVRTTSISGMLQRPSSQPQPQAHSTFPGQGFQPLNPPSRADLHGPSILTVKIGWGSTTRLRQTSASTVFQNMARNLKTVSQLNLQPLHRLTTSGHLDLTRPHSNNTRLLHTTVMHNREQPHGNLLPQIRCHRVLAPRWPAHVSTSLLEAWPVHRRR